MTQAAEANPFVAFLSKYIYFPCRTCYTQSSHCQTPAAPEGAGGIQKKSEVRA